MPWEDGAHCALPSLPFALRNKEPNLAGCLGKAPTPRKLIQQQKYVKKEQILALPVENGHQRYGSYEHIVKALVVKTNQLSRRRGPCTQ